MITIDTYKKFYKLTNYRVGDFIVDSEEFFAESMPIIVNFYSGRFAFIDMIHINKMNNLVEEAKKILGIFRDYKLMMNTVDYWELLDSIEDIKRHLNYAQKISKYLRSSIIEGKYQAGYGYTATMNSEQTIEDIQRNDLFDTNWDNNWSITAVDNDLREVDYDIDGGTNLSLIDKRFQSNLVTTMIDNTIGDRVYGKDIQKSIDFANDDLVVLSYKDTAYQTVDILARLAKNDIPEFPELGLNASVWKGTNVSSINYPMIVLDMTSVFNRDDLFTDFKVNNLQIVDGDIFIEYQVSTKRNLVIINNVTI